MGISAPPVLLYMETTKQTRWWCGGWTDCSPLTIKEVKGEVRSSQLNLKDVWPDIGEGSVSVY